MVVDNAPLEVADARDTLATRKKFIDQELIKSFCDIDARVSVTIYGSPCDPVVQQLIDRYSYVGWFITSRYDEYSGMLTLEFRSGSPLTNDCGDWLTPRSVLLSHRDKSRQMQSIIYMLGEEFQNRESARHASKSVDPEDSFVRLIGELVDCVGARCN